MLNLLLLSNSTNHASGYLDHAAAQITNLFTGVERIVFVPFALHDQVGYWEKARERFRGFGLEVERLVEGGQAKDQVGRARGIFVGGGNTFRLLDRLQRADLLGVMADRARSGTPYMGASAGTVIAAPTIMTTNDMPIVAPRSLDSLGLVPFQINCHYLDPDPASTHMGETREQRLREFHEEHAVPVLGLREGAMLRLNNGRLALGGAAGARLFVKDRSPEELQPGASLDSLLSR